MPAYSNPDGQQPPPTRWRLIRDVVVFQFKLVLDGFRDLLLSPISIVAALFGFFTNSNDPGKYFYSILKVGRDTDRWINLFNQHDDEPDTSVTADQVVQRAEALLRAEYEKGGVVRDLKERTDGIIDQIQGKAIKKPDESPNDSAK